MTVHHITAILFVIIFIGFTILFVIIEEIIFALVSPSERFNQFNPTLSDFTRSDYLPNANNEWMATIYIQLSCSMFLARAFRSVRLLLRQVDMDVHLFQVYFDDIEIAPSLISLLYPPWRANVGYFNDFRWDGKKIVSHVWWLSIDSVVWNRINKSDIVCCEAK